MDGAIKISQVNLKIILRWRYLNNKNLALNVITTFTVRNLNLNNDFMKFSRCIVNIKPNRLIKHILLFNKLVRLSLASLKF